MSIVHSNPKVLKWARKQSGWKVEDIVEKLKRKTVTVQTIHNWESGKEFPSYSQLENLAYKIYKRPLAVFFFPKPPDESHIKQSFRTFPESINNLSPRMRFMIRKAHSMQLNVMELSENNKKVTEENKIFKDIKFTTKASMHSLAQKVRKYFNINIEKQKNWSKQDNSADIAFKNWREIIQSHGIFVFKDSFKDPNFSGFCIYDQQFPVIYINNSEAKTRQIFTLFHELAHILFHTSGLDPIDENYFRRKHLTTTNKEIEMMCNEFAGAFLIPDESLPQEIHLRNIKKWANSYSVSQEVFLIRLLKNNRISRIDYNKLRKNILEEYQKFNKKKSQSGNYYATKGVYLGDKYISLAFKKYYNKQISLEQLADFLDIKPKNIIQIDPFKQRGVFK